MKYIQKCIDLYRKRYPSDDLQPIGCLEEELEIVEENLGVRLAEAHREFLLWAGHDKWGLFKEDFWFIDAIEDIGQLVITLLEADDVPLPEGKIVGVYSHEGYSVAWYDADTTDPDPLIYRFIEKDHEGEGPDPAIWGRFSDWVFEYMHQHMFFSSEQRAARKSFYAHNKEELPENRAKAEAEAAAAAGAAGAGSAEASGAGEAGIVVSGDAAKPDAAT